MHLQFDRQRNHHQRRIFIRERNVPLVLALLPGVQIGALHLQVDLEARVVGPGRLHLADDAVEKAPRVKDQGTVEISKLDLRQLLGHKRRSIGPGGQTEVARGRDASFARRRMLRLRNEEGLRCKYNINMVLVGKGGSDPQGADFKKCQRGCGKFCQRGHKHIKFHFWSLYPQ